MKNSNAPEELFETNPVLYLAKRWAVRYKSIVVDWENIITKDLQEKRNLANKVLLFSKIAKQVNNTDEIESKRWLERNKRKTEGKLTLDQRWAFSVDYFDLIENLSDKILNC